MQDPAKTNTTEHGADRIYAKWRSVTDVQKTWRMYGWVPPTEYRDDYLFKTNREFFQGV
jgi:hypothetical protein